jgi:hypothetical protein
MALIDHDPLPSGTITTNLEGLTRCLNGILLACNQDTLVLKEKMTWFWYHFIPVDFDTVRVSPFSNASPNSC